MRGKQIRVQLFVSVCERGCDSAWWSFVSVSIQQVAACVPSCSFCRACITPVSTPTFCEWHPSTFFHPSAVQHHSDANVPLLQSRRIGAHGSRRVRGAIARRSLGAFWRQVVQHARPLADSHEFLLLRRIAGFTERRSASCQWPARRAGQCSGNACSQGCSCRGTNEGCPGPGEIEGFDQKGFLASRPCMSKQSGKTGCRR